MLLRLLLAAGPGQGRTSPVTGPSTPPRVRDRGQGPLRKGLPTLCAEGHRLEGGGPSEGEPRHEPARRLRGGPPAPGDPAQAGPRAEEADPRPTTTSTSSTTCSGSSAPSRSTTRSPRRCATSASRCTCSTSCCARPWRCPRPASSCSRRLSTSASTGRWRWTACTACFGAMDDTELTRYLIGGMTKRELLERTDEPSSVVVQALEPRRLAAATVAQPHVHPRHLRVDLRRGVASTPCASGPGSARPIHYEAIYRWHPFFADARLQRLVGGRRSTGRPPPRAATSSCSAAAPCWSA